MANMKTYSYRLLAMAMLGLLPFVSCKKFLDDKPETALTTGNAYSTAKDAEAAIAGCYNVFYATDYYQWENVMLSDVRSDNAYPGGNNEETFYDYDRFILPPGNTHSYAHWRALYNGIARCNVLLNKIDGITDPALTAERKSQLIGEASFLRAYHYFHLVKLYGGVPLELESNSADPGKTRKARATEAQVYDQIVADLETALANLPDTYNGPAGSATANLPSVNKARATKGAANAMLAKAWAQRSDRDYAKVLQYCNAVISSPAGYALLANYNDVFDGNHDFNSESILEIAYEAGNWDASCWGVQLYLAPEDGWQKYCVPTKDLVAAYDAAGDAVRKNSNILFLTRDANNDPISWPDENWNPCQDPNTPIPFNNKQKDPGGWASGDNFYLLRLADIILLKAEAQNETGNPGQAASTLNLIRSRVGLAPVTGTSQAQLRTAILLERRLELAFEGHRWDDLVRAGVATTVMQALNEYTYSCPGGVQSAPVRMDYSQCTQQRWVLPIPSVEMNNNPLLTQNPGY